MSYSFSLECSYSTILPWPSKWIKLNQIKLNCSHCQLLMNFPFLPSAVRVECCVELKLFLSTFTHCLDLAFPWEWWCLRLFCSISDLDVPYVAGDLQTKAEEGMFAGFNLARVGLSQNPHILHIFAVLLPCFRQVSTLLYRAPEMPGYNHFPSGLLKILLCYLDIYSLQPALSKKTMSHLATLWSFPWLLKQE